MIVVNFDCLAFPNDELGARLPDPDGMKLWRMFHEQNRGAVGLVYKGDLYDKAKKEIFEDWLKRERIKASFYEEITADITIQEEKVHRLSTMFGRADWYIDNDVPLCTRLVRRGVRCFLYANPQIIMPEWHESRSVRPWDELTAELDRQAEMLAERSWGEMEGSHDER
jgi:hypothetical protein